MKVVARAPHRLALWCCLWHGSCQLCGERSTKAPSADIFGRIVCQYCHQSLIWRLPVMKIGERLPLLCVSFYEMPLNRVMAQYKDKQQLSALLVLYHAICQIPKPKLKANAIIIPIPTTNSRLVKRGFYPVLTLAKFLSYWWQVPVWQGVARQDNQTHQRGLDKQHRLSNVKEDFYLLEELPSRQVILFDDVVTTGATLSALAQTLWNDYPNLQILAVSVLHGKPKLHLPVWQS